MSIPQRRVPKKANVGALVTLNDGHDAETAKELRARYRDAQTGLRRVVSFGLLAWEVKERRLSHGRFGAWLAQHVPELSRVDGVTGRPKASATLSTYMELTRGVLDSCGFTVEKYLAHISNSQHLGICHGGKYLLLPDRKLPEAVRPLKEKICAIVDGKTQRQLFLEFKQAESDPVEPDRLRPKVGRLKGQGGATREQREASREEAERARLEVIELRAREVTEWMVEVADDRHLGMVDEGVVKRLHEAARMLVGYLNGLARARAGAGKGDQS